MALAASGETNADVLFATDFDTKAFVRIDTGTGAVTSLGTGQNVLRGMALAPDGVLYGYGLPPGQAADRPTLYAIDRASGAQNEGGQLQLVAGTPFEGDIAFAPDGTGYLFASQNINGDLYRFDAATGAATLLGESSMADANSLVVRSDGVLVYQTSGSVRLFDTLTGFESILSTNAAAVAFSNIGGMASFDGQTAWMALSQTGSPAGTRLVRFDLYNGAIYETIQLDTPVAISGLAIPAPGGLAMLVGGGCLAARRRRRRPLASARR